MMASLGKAEGRQQAKGVRNVKTPKRARADKGPTWVTQVQMWADLLAVGVDKNKIDKQSNAILLELWKQLSPKKQFTKYENHPQHDIWAVQLGDFMPFRDGPANVLFCFEQGSGQGACPKSPYKDKRSHVELAITGHWLMYKE